MAIDGVLYFLFLTSFSISISYCHNCLFSSALSVLCRPSGVLLQVVNMQLLLMLVVLEIMMSLASVHMAFVGM